MYRGKKYRVYEVVEFSNLGRWDEYWQFKCTELDAIVGSCIAFSIVGITELETLAELVGVSFESEITFGNGFGSGQGLSGPLSSGSRREDAISFRNTGHDRVIGSWSA